MKTSELVPAAAIAFLVTAGMCGAQLLPFGKAMLLVRTSLDPKAALTAAAVAGAALVSVPAPGFAVLYGDASHMRGALGFAMPWKGAVPCSSNP